MKIISYLDQHPGLSAVVILGSAIFHIFYYFAWKLIPSFWYIFKSPIKLTFYNKARAKETPQHYFITPIMTIFNRHPFKKVPIAGIKMLNRIPNPFDQSELSELTSMYFIVTNENGRELQFPFFLDTRKKYLVRFNPKTATFPSGWQILKQVDILPKENILVELFKTTGEKVSYRLSDIEVKYED